MNRRNAIIAAFCIFFLLAIAAAGAAEPLKPFIMAPSRGGDLSTAVENVRQALASGGLEIVGDYAPYEGAHIFVVTTEDARTAASKSETGGYGAIQRVSVNATGDAVQVAYTNPEYMANAYRMVPEAAAINKQLKDALGFDHAFGSEKGLEARKLRKYHYMFMMPYFDDQDELASHGSYQEALAKVESGLANGRKGAQKVYRVDIPGKEETVFGVALPFDADIMKVVDTSSEKHTAHLCYEMLVSGKKVYALRGKFRIALNFPDLTMGTFMKISSAPSDIMWALRDVALDRQSQD